jgi:predicted RNA-binding protein with PIN domain
VKILIDGHNLIGRMSELALGDPHVEARLVGLLRRYAAQTGHRLTVIFDGGLPGGPERELSGGGVEVIFAPSGRSADPLIIKRLRRVRDRQGTLVVSSDRQIVEAAGSRRLRVRRAEDFAAELEPSSSPEEPDPRQTPPSDAEVEAWLREFLG